MQFDQINIEMISNIIKFEKDKYYGVEPQTICFEINSNNEEKINFYYSKSI